MPVLGLGGGYTPAFGGNITMPNIVYGKDISSDQMFGILQFQIQDIGLQKRAQTCNKSS